MIEQPPAKDEAKDWFFTFGHGQVHYGHFVRINGTFGEARAEMFKRYGPKWSMQYDADGIKNLIERWHYTELL